MSQNLELLMSESASQWRTVSYVAPEIQKKEIKPFVILALKELEGAPDGRTSSLVSVDKYAAVRAVVRHFTRLRSSTRDVWSSDDVGGFLENIRFSPECIGELTALLCSEKLYENIQKHLRVKPGLVGLRWKIDISLSLTNIEAESASAERSKEIMHRDTYVILVLSMTDGTRRHYRISVNKFQELRYVVATLLKNMIVLEKRKCMRKD